MAGVQDLNNRQLVDRYRLIAVKTSLVEGLSEEPDEEDIQELRKEILRRMTKFSRPRRRVNRRGLTKRLIKDLLPPEFLKG